MPIDIEIENSIFQWIFFFIPDPFDFTLSLEAINVGAHSVDLSWTGVPLPRQTYVNLYRILYLEEATDLYDPHSAFIVSNIDTITSTRIDVLRPSTAYQIWLEAYLRNGKVVKSSNVLAITTKHGSVQGNSNYYFCKL